MEIKLKYGIDNLLFGMKEQDVTKILGKPDTQYKDEEENVVFMYNARTSFNFLQRRSIQIRLYDNNKSSCEVVQHDFNWKELE